ncbi:CPBP family intramembrane glutamic endopeptidase [Gordonia sp. OPL2]|uniref:CPBP family intramembrane glutamic endopeptidase n=1 Tax=Gordonia sp. OPL2 TaxID=2486274 RepID=UPI0016552F20|nr:CPBP family intramembrane glutamic endopeptidase [Gordonia sp. OPL2]RPA02588.1 CPBP family intramembrane metalloprotease [Gordonia sp. OPL2]
MTTPATSGVRRLSYAGFAAVVLVYLVIIQGGGLLLQKLTDVDSTTTTRGVVVGMIIPLGVALVFVIGVVTYLGWWRPVLRDDRRVSRWVWVIPVAFVVAILIAIDYGALADTTTGFVLTLLIATQLVGWGEELMFRGLGVTVLREHGLGEGRVALWSSVIFGAVHLTNAIGHGLTAIPQALVVSVAGYFFYLIRRVSGTNVLNSVLHGLFDFALLSGTAILVDQAGYPGSFAAIVLYVVLAVVLVVRRRRIEPAT